MTKPLDNSAIAQLLRELAQRSALKGGNPYRAKAYARAAESVSALASPLGKIIAEGRLKEIPGIGDTIADIITKLHANGTHPSLEAMRKEIPAGVLEMLSVPGLRPEQALRLYNSLGISSLDELEQAARQDLIKKTKGFGAALQSKILDGLELRSKSTGRLHMHRAADLLEFAKRSLQAAHPELTCITFGGDFRRGCELVSDLALVGEMPSVPQDLERTLLEGDVKIYVATPASYGATLLWATGSEKHIAALSSLAQRQGLSLDRRGVSRHGKLIAGKTEQGLYRALGLPFIEPELRETGDEVQHAISGSLPSLVKDSDLRGILHVHTDLSDGVDTLEAMAEATRGRGYEYLGVADHSQSAHYAGGLSIDEVNRQHRAIERLNNRYAGQFRILKGIEVDILADGSLDYSDEILARFDFVVASVHSRFRLDREAQTARIIRAVQNPRTTILGHMTGRQLLRRPGYKLDIERVLQTCGQHGVALEINANPWRLDLDWRWHGYALEAGCLMSINPDAHSIREIDLTHWGVEMARKGGVPAKRVLNSFTLTKLLKYLAETR